MDRVATINTQTYIYICIKSQGNQGVYIHGYLFTSALVTYNRLAFHLYMHE